MSFSLDEFTLRLATQADLPAVDAFRRQAYADAPWLLGIDPESVLTARDSAGTRVMVAELNGEVVGTSAVKLAWNLAELREELDANRFEPGLTRYPVLVCMRTAVASHLRGGSVVALFRKHYLSAARNLGVGAVCSGHAAATPNVSGLQRLGYDVHDMGLQPLGTLGGATPTRVLVCCLPSQRFELALQTLFERSPGLEDHTGWQGVSLTDSLAAEANAGAAALPVV